MGRDRQEQDVSQPGAMSHLLAWEEALNEILPERLVVAIGLTIATHAGSERQSAKYRRLATAAAMGADEVDALESGRLSRRSTLGEEEVAAAALSRCLVDGYGIGCEPAVLRLSRLVGEEDTVACLMLAGLCMGQATMDNAWRPRIPEGS
jgi:hypothetical protein